MNYKKSSTLLRVTLWSFFLFAVSLLLNCNSNIGNDNTDNIDLALKEVNQMSECRIKAENKDFYLHKHKADKLINGYGNDYAKLNIDDRKRLINVKSKYAFAYVDYLIQIGKRSDAQLVIDDFLTNTLINIQSDTTIWLDYLYHQGKAQYMPYDVRIHKENILKGYDCLIQCYIIAKRNGYAKFEGLSMLTLSPYFSNPEILEMVKEFDAASVRYINENGVTDSLMAGNLAERSLYILQNLDEPYLVADAWRTLAACYFLIGDAQHSLECLNNALANPIVEQAPDLNARINEQLSMTYSAMNDKHMSDLFRNQYLDQQDSARQDRELEARVVSLKEATERIWIYVIGALAIFLLLCIMTIVLTQMRKRKLRNNNLIAEEIEELQEKLSMLRLQYGNAQRIAVEQRARISVINGMLPLIDRMRIALGMKNLNYVSELAVAIENQNAMLTRWIKLKQGLIAPRIETVKIQNIFNLIVQNKNYFSKSAINLTVKDTDAKVKADYALTLFIINTIMDNARKNTPAGGHVEVSCTENKDGNYAEISVSDNGKGMSPEQAEHIFEYKTILDDPSSDTSKHESHGFGLQNCRGIIDRYKKISSMFSVCNITAESKLGKGTRIAIRLPLAVKTFIFFFLMSCNIHMTYATNTAGSTETNKEGRVVEYSKKASAYGDSIYTSNINGNYKATFLYADSCLSVLNKAYLQENPSSKDTLSLQGRTADITWWRSKYRTDYDLILSVRNELAVAALALHDWNSYRYNNYFYTQLYKECTSDTTLTTYCQTMEQNEMKANIAMLVMIILILSLLPLFWFIYLRHVLRYRRDIASQKGQLEADIKVNTKEYNFLHVSNNIMDNQLSTLKHETMYYPTRIRQQIISGATEEEISSTLSYYRSLYSMLSVKVLSGEAHNFNFPMEAIDVESLWKDIRILESDGCESHNKTKTRILANRELIIYLNILLKEQNNGKTPSVSYITPSEGDSYVNISFEMNSLRHPYSDEELSKMFTPETHDVDFLILRQIVREIGNATMHYACGIKSICKDNTSLICITLPLKEDFKH